MSTGDMWTNETGKRIYISDDDQTIVFEGDPQLENNRRTFVLLAGVGGQVSADRARQLDLDQKISAAGFTPPGHGGTPPGQGGTPPGQTQPPGHGGTPPGQNTPEVNPLDEDSGDETDARKAAEQSAGNKGKPAPANKGRGA